MPCKSAPALISASYVITGYIGMVSHTNQTDVANQFMPFTMARVLLDSRNTLPIDSISLNFRSEDTCLIQARFSSYSYLVPFVKGKSYNFEAQNHIMTIEERRSLV